MTQLPALSEIAFVYVEVFDREAPVGNLRAEGIDLVSRHGRRSPADVSGDIARTAAWLKSKFDSDYGVRVNEYSASGQVLRSTVL